MDENTIVGFSQRCTQKSKDLFLEINAKLKSKNQNIKLQDTLDIIIQSYAAGTIPQLITNNNEFYQRQIDEKEKRIQELTEQIGQLKLNAGSGTDEMVDKLTEENKQLKSNIESLNVVKETTINTNYELQAEIEKLKEQSGIPANYLPILPYVYEILLLVTERVNKNENKEYTPPQIVENYIVNYNCKGLRYFHDFYISKKDILEIKNKLETQE